MNIGVAPIENAYLNLSFESRYHDYSFRGDVDPRVTNTAFNINSSSRLSRYPHLINDPDFPYLNRIAGDAEYRLNVGSFNAGYDGGRRSNSTPSAPTATNTPRPTRTTGCRTWWSARRLRSRAARLQPAEVIYETDYAFTGGVSRRDGGRLELGPQHLRQRHVKVNTKDSFNRSLYIDTSTLTTPGFSPTDFHAGDFISTQWTTQLDVSKDFDVGMASR
jgi:iron complex outermembrane receptor protein